jgi:hypothetical protein
MAQVYRSMVVQDDRPKIGSNSNELGVRVAPHRTPDVTPDPSGRVFASVDQGLSVAPSIDAMYDHLIPKRLRARFPRATGRDSMRVWTMGSGPFESSPMTDDLRLAVTGPNHGVIAPGRDMLVEDFQAVLASTRENWELAK